MKTKPKISIMILNWNGKAILQKTLQSLLPLRGKKDYEVLVVDNASSDGSQAMVHDVFPWVRLVQTGANHGCPGLNFGVKHCKGKYIFYAGNDMEIPEKALRVLLSYLDKHKEVVYAVPLLLNAHNHDRIDTGVDWLSRSFYVGLIDKKVKKPTELTGGGTGMLRKAILKDILFLYDPDYFMYAEDLDLGLRIRLAGLKTMLIPEAVMYHMGSATLNKEFQRPRQVYYMERNLLMTFFKTVSLFHLFAYLPYVLFMRFAAMIRDVLRLHFSLAAARIGALGYILFHLGNIFQKRHAVQRIRKKSDDYVFKHITEKYLWSR